MKKVNRTPKKIFHNHRRLVYQIREPANINSREIEILAPSKKRQLKQNAPNEEKRKNRSICYECGELRSLISQRIEIMSFGKNRRLKNSEKIAFIFSKKTAFLLIFRQKQYFIQPTIFRSKSWKISLLLNWHPEVKRQNNFGYPPSLQTKSLHANHNLIFISTSLGLNAY